MVIYLDTGDLSLMSQWASHVSGFTTNPSLMKKAGIKRYKEFALRALEIAEGKPISFEVFADDADEILKQAETMVSWGENIFVKVPITTTDAVFNGLLISRLWRYCKIKVNITAVMTREQISDLDQFLSRKTPMIISIFAGRIADTGVDPTRTIAYAKMRYRYLKNVQMLWASTREVYNIRQAESCNCDIITVSPEILSKRDLFGKDLAQYSLETVRQFYKDAEGIVL